jgi:hypothetical protein
MADEIRQIRVRRDTAANWTGIIPVAGEPTFEQDTGRFRVADGSTRNDDLDYAAMVNPNTNEFHDDVKAALARSFVTLTAAAKNPDLLIVGSITRNADGVITAAAVVWPDGSAGTFTTEAIDPSGAINRYRITYGSPAVRTFTQPTITRNSSGAAVTVPQIVVS